LIVPFIVAIYRSSTVIAESTYRRNPTRTSSPYRLNARRRPAFHTSPHVSHRQYVFASTATLVVLIFDDPQKGQTAGAGTGAVSSDAVFIERQWPRRDASTATSVRLSLSNGCWMDPDYMGRIDRFTRAPT
jgi:hypothetical protein